MTHSSKRKRTRRRPHRRSRSRRPYNGHGGVNAPSRINTTAFDLETALEDRETRQSRLLLQMCSNPDKCIDLEPFQHLLEDYFDHFNEFRYLRPDSIVKLNKGEGSNGEVVRVAFYRNRYTAYCVFKMATSHVADNLFYEYWIGRYFVNRCCSSFPTFLKTYHLYSIPTSVANNLHEFFDAVTTNTYSPLQYSFNTPTLPKNACSNTDHLILSIQHLGKFVSFYRAFFGPLPNRNPFVPDFIPLLFQVYFALSSLGNTYTHYDLHLYNVGVYAPYSNTEYIEMHYHMKDGSVLSFPTRYIAKVLDYGRNYARLSNTIDSATFMQQVCSTRDCDPSCGYDFGFLSQPANTFMRQHYHIDPTLPNISIDLRFLASAMTERNLFNTALPNHGVTVRFGLNGEMLDPHSHSGVAYGTPEQTQSTFSPNNRVVSNVHDAYEMLAFFLRTEPSIRARLEEKYGQERQRKVADMHVWYDQRPYTYTSISHSNKIKFDASTSHPMPPPIPPASLVPPNILRPPQPLPPFPPSPTNTDPVSASPFTPIQARQSSADTADMNTYYPPDMLQTKSTRKRGLIQSVVNNARQLFNRSTRRKTNNQQVVPISGGRRRRR